MYLFLVTRGMFWYQLYLCRTSVARFIGLWKGGQYMHRTYSCMHLLHTTYSKGLFVNGPLCDTSRLMYLFLVNRGMFWYHLCLCRTSVARFISLWKGGQYIQLYVYTTYYIKHGAVRKRPTLWLLSTQKLVLRWQTNVLVPLVPLWDVCSPFYRRLKRGTVILLTMFSSISVPLSPSSVLRSRACRRKVGDITNTTDPGEPPGWYTDPLPPSPPHFCPLFASIKSLLSASIYTTLAGT